MDFVEDHVESAVPTIETAIDSIFTRLKIIAVDVEKVLRAKELLASLQRRKTFFYLLGQDDDGSIENNHSEMRLLTSKHSFPSILSGDDDFDGEELSEDQCGDWQFQEENRWHSYFSGFQVLTTRHGADPNENRKCVQLSAMLGCDQEIKTLLRNGVRCFLLDLFAGTQRDNQSLIVQLREAEISVSKEYGFPVASTIFVKLSPRFQYTGYLNPQHYKGDLKRVELKKGCNLTLTVDREFSDSSSSSIIYVNARFLLGDVKTFDFILIGNEIQLTVHSVNPDHLNCCVVRGGMLSSYMPVLFPKRCSKFRISYEELEDLTFAREVGVNVVVSNIVGTAKYLDNLENAMGIMQCENLRMFARVVLNDIKGCDGELNWATRRYDGFLVELAEPEVVPDVMHLCPDAECFLQLVHAAKKPIIFDPEMIHKKKLRIDPTHYYYTFYYPDKYLVKSHKTKQSFYFSFLQNALFEKIPTEALAKVPYCDNSHTGADGLARAVVTAAMEVHAAAIVVIGVTARMVQKISHFRPEAPIIFVSHMRSAEDYVSLYYNVTMLSFRTKQFHTHRQNIFRKGVYALAYLAKRKVVRQHDYVILVYSHKEGTTFPEKYILYKFDKSHFAEHMSASMFPTQQDQQESTADADANN
ncbi:pyruvate kinase [Drosophila subobscura]|uniref:pyruvate kinase n=1 Tax=Drosophila subobscura TaxID=7241 RepID=UPI00155A2FE7|nr:pyruvate kinase [Drosophila subobscura]